MAPVRSQSSRYGTYVRRARRPRRRTSVATRTHRSKSAKAQAGQIRTVARQAARNTAILKSQRCIMDYSLRGKSTEGWINNTWNTFDLLNPGSFVPTMRQSLIGNAEQSAYISSMNLQYVASLNTLTRSSAITMFIVSIRPSAANFSPVAANLIENQSYQQGGPLSSPRLNPAIFKVHFSKSFMVLSNGLSGLSITQSATDAVGDPESTFVRGNINVKLGIKLRSRATLVPPVSPAPATPPKPWSTLSSQEIPYYNRRWLLFYQQSGDPTNVPAFYWNALFRVVTD